MERNWQCDKAQQDEATETITLLQWNILSQTLGVYGDFMHAKEEDLQWEHRKPLLVEEILRYNADIVCLEEVDCYSQLSESLGDTNNPDGFTGVWIPKPSSPCLKFQGNIGPDGNAIFWKNSKFTLSKSYHHVLQGEDGKPSNGTVLCCQLEDNKTKKTLTVMATHLKAKKGFESLRAAQTEHILRILRTENQDRVILAGDFNAGLEEAGYEKVRSAGLESAYKKVLGQEPEYTTWKIRKGEPGCDPLEKKATIDFIFYTPGGVSCSSVLDVPTIETLGPNLLPSPTFPSDHMSLSAKFVIL